MSTSHFCEHCGAMLASDARFCEACGTPVESLAQPAPASPGAATPRSTNRRLFVGVAIAGVIITLGCLAIAAFGFLFLQNKPPSLSQLLASTPQIAMATPSVTRTNIPATITLSPTAKPVLPTSTPSPTAVPIPPTSIPTLAPTGTATPVRCQPITTRSTNNGTIGPIVFAPGATRDRQPIDPTTTFPEGVTEVYGIFAYSGMRNGSAVREEWCLDGYLRYEDKFTWNWGEHGNTGSSLYLDNGLRPGNYELRWYIANQLAQLGTFTIEKRQAGAPFFGPIRFAEGRQNNQPVNVHTRNQRFKAGTREVFAFFESGNLTNGLVIQGEWYRDGALYTVPFATSWTGSASDILWSVLSDRDKQPLAPATYELKMYINDQLAQIATFIVEP